MMVPSQELSGRKIALFAMGSAGDVRPYVELAAGLQDAGYQVSVCAFDTFRPAIEQRGITFQSLGPFPKTFSERWGNVVSVPEPTFSGIGGRGIFWLLYSLMLAKRFEYFLSGAAQADLIVYSRLAFPVLHVGQKLNIPCIAGFIVPHTATEEVADPLLFSNQKFLQTGIPAKLSYLLENGMMNQFTLQAINRCRKRFLQLPAVPRLRKKLDGPRPVITVYCHGKHVLLRPKDWPEDIIVTEYWRESVGDRNMDSLPASLQRFVNAGSAPVFCGFGSLSSKCNATVIRRIAHVLEENGLRAIFQCGTRNALVPDCAHFFVLPDSEEVPHSLLFPRMSMIIHHGGIGTLTQAVAAKVPSLVIPLAYDQFFWADRVEAAKLGRSFSRQSDVTEKRLKQKVQVLLSDENIHQHVARAGERILAEDGVFAAVASIESVFK